MNLHFLFIFDSLFLLGLEFSLSSANEDCPNLKPNSINQSRFNLESLKCFPVSRANAIPWRNISRDQAILACAKAKKRLPTNKEWQQAALGTPDLNDNWSFDDCQVNNNWKKQPGYTGSGKNCISSAGVYDMIGNVWEWVSNSVVNGNHNNTELPDAGFVGGMGDDGIPGITNFDEPNKNYNNDYFWINKIGLRGIVRGGYWNNKTDAGQYSAYIINQPFQAEAGIGFRCVK